jgi:hypothetical protein
MIFGEGPIRTTHEKNIWLKEKMSYQLRAKFFNEVNPTQFKCADSNINAADLGVISSAPTNYSVGHEFN